MADEVYGLSSSDRDKLIAGMHAGNDAMRRLQHSGTVSKGFQTTTTLLIGEATKAMKAGDVEDFKRVTGDHEETVEKTGVVKAKLLYGSVSKEDKVFLILLERFLWYAIPKSSGGAKYFTTNGTLTDCTTVSGTEVTVSASGSCLATAAVTPTVTATLHETSYLVSRHNLARKKKLDTPLPSGTVVECVAFTAESTSESTSGSTSEPAPEIWRIVDFLDCECPPPTPEEDECSVIGGVDLSEVEVYDDAPYGLALDENNCLVKEDRGCNYFSGLKTDSLEASAQAAYGLAINGDGCVVKEPRGCTYFSGQTTTSIGTGTPAFVIGIDGSGCLCKIAVAPCVPTPPTDPPPTDPPPDSPGGGE